MPKLQPTQLCCCRQIHAVTERLTVYMHIPKARNCLCSHPLFSAAETAKLKPGLVFYIWHRPPINLILKGSKKERNYASKMSLSKNATELIHLVRL